MVALEFALMYPERVKKLVVLAAPARHGPWARAFNHLSRQAILQDPEYQKGNPAPKGMALARGIAMMSYRAPEGFEARWGAEPELGKPTWTTRGRSSSGASTPRATSSSPGPWTPTTWAGAGAGWRRP